MRAIQRDVGEAVGGSGAIEMYDLARHWIKGLPLRRLASGNHRRP